MPVNHRGVPTGDNHRPTPRLAKALAANINAKIDSSYEDLMSENPLMGYTMAGTPRYMQEHEAQHAIDRYRGERNEGSQWTPAEQEDLKEAIRNRHSY